MNPQDYAVDVLIVGGGSAGAVLAARLSEDPDRTVLLLEAGEAFQPADAPQFVRDVDVPGGTPESIWQEPEMSPLGHPTTHIRAKVLGGGSSINAAVFCRGLPSDFARWSSRALKGWTYDDVLPYFRKSETDPAGDRELHGDSGPLQVERYLPEEMTPPQRAFLESAQAAGFPYVADLNSRHSGGVGPIPMNRVGHVRESTALAYLTEEVWQRDNLIVRGGSLVDTVLIENGRADGVRLADGSEVRAREVVLSAGSVGSAAILLRSGVGPAKDLTALDIDVHADLPVGRNLSEQPCTYLIFAMDPATAGPTVPPIGSFLHYASALARPGETDVHVFPSHLVGPELSPTGAVLGMLIAVARPEPASLGSLRITSTDPAAEPEIDLGLMKDPRDLAKFVEAVGHVRRIVSTGPMADLVGEEIVPGVQHTSDEELSAVLPGLIKTYLHLSSTAPMGAPGDPRAVVDTDGRVFGLTGLRVIDASIFPDVPSNATNPTVIMTAEKLADTF